MEDNFTKSNKLAITGTARNKRLCSRLGIAEFALSTVEQNGIFALAGNILKAALWPETFLNEKSGEIKNPPKSDLKCVHGLLWEDSVLFGGAGAGISEEYYQSRPAAARIFFAMGVMVPY